MSNNFLSFISDQDLIHCIHSLHMTYLNCQQGMTINNFYKNKVDPIKFFYDMQFNNMNNIKNYLDLEIIRQNDKTISNAIGTFHQSLIGKLPGLIDLGVGQGCDVKNSNNTLFGEIKNKHNTMNSSSMESTFQKLQSFAQTYPNSTCYLIEIIATASQDIPWAGKFNGTYYSHPRVRRISADRFYAMVTGIPDAFKQLCMILPSATQYYMSCLQQQNPSITSSNSLFNTLNTRAQQYGVDVLSLIFSDNFNTYNGF